MRKLQRLTRVGVTTHIEEILDFLEPLIARIGDYITMNEIVLDLLAERTQGWFIGEEGEPRTFCITRVVEYNTTKHRVFVFEHGCGHLDDAVEFLAQYEEQARIQGCDRMRIEGRKGWSRVFPDWHETTRTIEKEIV